MQRYVRTFPPSLSPCQVLNRLPAAGRNTLLPKPQREGHVLDNYRLCDMQAQS